MCSVVAGKVDSYKFIQMRTRYFKYKKATRITIVMRVA